LKDNINNTEADEAIDDYLDMLLDTDAHMACEEKIIKSAPRSRSMLYPIDSHPGHNPSIKPDARHNLERVERLMDDFNNRQQEPPKPVTEQSADLSTANKLLLQPALLQPRVSEGESTETTIAEEDVDSLHTKQAKTNAHTLERQDWSKEPFQTLIFDVAGLTLALPLVKLGGIHKIEQQPTSLIGKPDWFIGLTPGYDRNISVIDTARWVMPEKYQQARDAGLDYQFLILLGDSNWGLACSSVQNAISLSPENVRWRSATSKRPWLNGMLIDEMCALLDVDTLIHLLDENFPR